VGAGGLAIPAEGTISPHGHLASLRETHGHAGIDIGGVEGSPIHASEGGKIVYSGWVSGYGYTIDVIGDKTKRLYRYAHLRPGSLLSGGQVGSGQQIAQMGHSAVGSGFTHLHYEIHRPGAPTYFHFPRGTSREAEIAAGAIDPETEHHFQPGRPIHFADAKPAEPAESDKRAAHDAAHDAERDREVIDKKATDSGDRVKISPNGTLKTKVTAPKGTKVSVEGGGVFKRTETERISPLVEQLGGARA
jgi:hypothetical protein